MNQVERRIERLAPLGRKTQHKEFMWMGALLLSAGMALSFGLGHKSASYDPYRQANFPCREDEALMYAPQFGPDRVGCMSVDVSVD